MNYREKFSIKPDSIVKLNKIMQHSRTNTKIKHQHGVK
jgi:hypothetical protein